MVVCDLLEEVGESQLKKKTFKNYYFLLYFIYIKIK